MLGPALKLYTLAMVVLPLSPQNLQWTAAIAPRCMNSIKGLAGQKQERFCTKRGLRPRREVTERTNVRGVRTITRTNVGESTAYLSFCLQKALAGRPQGWYNGQNIYKCRQK